MEKQQINNNFFIPMPVVLVGALVKGKANFMTVGWCARANANPPMITCGIGNHHYTPKGIAETKTFSVNIPSADLMDKTDYCGIVSGEKTDKAKVFDVFYGATKTAPMIRECPVSLECRLVQVVPLQQAPLVHGFVVQLVPLPTKMSGATHVSLVVSVQVGPAQQAPLRHGFGLQVVASAS